MPIIIKKKLKSPRLDPHWPPHPKAAAELAAFVAKRGVNYEGVAPTPCAHCEKPYLSGGCSVERRETCQNYLFKQGLLAASV